MGEESRCRTCGWPVYATIQEGCTASSCSFRGKPVDVLTPESRASLTRLRAVALAAEAAGTDEDNPDTCGVCGKHFADCDQDQITEDDHTSAIHGDFVTFPACAGARIRAALSACTKEDLGR